MSSLQKQGKMAGYVDYRMRATLKDGRQIVGQMLAFDKHMNLVLSEAEEFRKVKRKSKNSGAPGTGGPQFVEQEEKRGLGLAIVRGANIVSCSVDGPPPADPSQRVGTSMPGGGPAAASAMQSGPGTARPAAGRGVGLQGPAAGVGVPGFGGPPAGPPGAFPPGPGRGGPPGFGGPPAAPFGGPPGFGGGRGYGGPPGFGPR